MSTVRRVYVEKKPEFAIKAKDLKHEIKHYLNIQTVTNVRELIRYDVENISDETYEKACKVVFAEPPVDICYQEDFPRAEGARVFSVEFLPGQFDQRADSAVQCVQFLKEDEQPIIRSAVTYVIEGEMTDEQFDAVKAHCINPVDSRETGLEKPETLVTKFEEPADVKIFDGFIDMPEAELKAKSIHDRDPRTRYLLVRSLPPYHLLHRAYQRDLRRRRLLRADEKKLRPLLKRP